MKRQEILYNILNKISIFTILIITFATSFLMVFLPDEYLIELRLLNFINRTGYVFGILFISTGISLIYIYIIKIYNKNRKEEILKNLTPSEKYFLSKYIYNETKTNNFSNITDGILLGLKNKGILHNPKKFVDLSSRNEPLNIDYWVWNYLKKHKELLKFDSKETIFLTKNQIGELQKLEGLREENDIFKSSQKSK